MNYFKALLLLSMTLMLSSCSSDDSGGGAQGGIGEVAAALTNQATPSATLSDDIKASATKTDRGRYHGRHNGNRPTWYFPRNMSSYPSKFKVSIPGCSSFEVRNNNGRRYVNGGYIVKQSDVPGRGLALVAPAGCSSRSASITFVPK